jgi:GNAT superfamily N-acetyltransferase
MNLEGFLVSRLANTHLDEPGLRVYVRKSNRLWEGRLLPCLDIGNVTVDEEQRGRGVFTDFLERFEEAARKMGRASLVECILEPRLYAFLLRRGYRDLSMSHPLSPTVVRIWPQ